MNRLLAILSLFLIWSCGTNKQESEMPLTFSLDSLQSELRLLYQSKIPEQSPGAQLLVVYGKNTLVGEGFGFADYENKKRMTTISNMRMASVSKQFTALCVLTLVKQQKLNLEDEVYQYFPNEIFKGVTVLNLIQHTSGLPDYTEYFTESWDTTKVVTNQDVMEWLATNAKPDFKPGEKWKYSNTAYIVLASLVDKLGDYKFREFAEWYVFDKARMANTSYYTLADPHNIPNRAYCYSKNDNSDWQRADGNFLNGVMGDGAVYTSTMDFYYYTQALYYENLLTNSLHGLLFKGGPDVPKENAYTYEFLNGKPQKYAMGWFVTEDKALHTGGWIGTRTIVVRDLNRPVTIAVFLNSDNGELRDELIEKTYKLVDLYLKVNYPEV